MNMKALKPIISIFSAIFLWLYYYLLLPPLSLAYEDGFLFFAVCAAVVIANIVMWASDDWAYSGKSLAAVLVVAIVAFGGVEIASMTCFWNDDAKYRQLGEVEVVEYDEMIQQIDLSQIPIVDQELAQKQADKKIGEDVALGSRIDLGEANIQEVNGEVIYVAPLEHSGFFKWNKHRTTPGYITVSASNENKVNYVTELNGEKIELLYQTSAFFSHNLKRYIRNNGYRTVGLTEYTFEIDETGQPYWVVTTYENRTVWSSPEATGVVVVDAQTGEINWYAVKDVPDWVDIVQPEDFVENQINNWGKLVHGWWNVSDTDKIKQTELTRKVYANGDCYYFTGMTSVGNDESCVGFIMVNTRNKKAMMAYMSGATEKAAMSSAEELVANFGYTATEPYPSLVNGVPTYILTFKGDEGLIKAYGMVNIQNYTITVKGNNLLEANRTYMQAMANSGTNYVAGSIEAYCYILEGIVERISSATQDGSSYYYIIMQGENEKIFTASYSISNELPLTRDGDKVVISYVDDKNGTVDILSFDNVAFATPISDDQQKRNELDEGSSALDSDYNKIIQVDPNMSEEKWNSMTEEEKAKMLQQFFDEN